MYVTKLRSRPPDVVSALHVEPLFVDVTRWPFAYGLKFDDPAPAVQLHVYAVVPVENAAEFRKMNAYRVPAVSVTGLSNVNVCSPPAPPSLKPGIVAVARSEPVGTGVVPVVARIDRVMVGPVVVHPEQNSSTSTRLSWPLTVGVNVWPAQPVFVKPKPVGLTDGLFASVLSGLARTMLPGLATRSQFVGMPRWSVLCVLSVKHPL